MQLKVVKDEYSVPTQDPVDIAKINERRGPAMASVDQAQIYPQARLHKRR
jgi:hypothetical protein